MGNVRYEFKGGVYNIAPGQSCKFLLFLVSNGKEISFYEAVKNRLTTRVTEQRHGEFNPHLYETDCQVVKIFLQEQTFGSPRFMYSFYMLLGRNFDRQIISIQPRRMETKAAGYIFKAEGRFLKKSEALQLFLAGSYQYKLIERQGTPAVDILRQIITLERPLVVEQAKATRSLRIRD